jgi:aryl-phospho-beta-D-glucosidase BglC (GH1 family)
MWKSAVLGGKRDVRVARRVHQQLEMSNSMGQMPIALEKLEKWADGYLQTSGGQILDADGKVARITGINWFGLETPTFAPHGLDRRGCKEMMRQIRKSGFNTIRLPFCGELFDVASRPKGIDFTRNPDLLGCDGLGIIDKIVEYAGILGLRIILDHHRPEAGFGPFENGLWFTDKYPESTWIARWVMLASRYAGNPTVMGADLHNEPHGLATWGGGERLIDWRLAAERAGNAILEANPHWLIFVEGIDRGRSGNYWWGGNLSDAGAYPVRLAIPGRLVYSAHDYPASIYHQSWFDDSDYPKNLPDLWDKNWGYLVRQNIAPVFLGEFGSKLATRSDRQWLTELVRYLNGNGGTSGRSQHQAISWAWWSWNPDSTDTGGILDESWTTVDQKKIIALAPAMFPFHGSTPTAVAHTHV